MDRNRATELGPSPFPGSREQTGLALVLESEALAVDAHDDRVVKDPIEHRRGKNGVAGERAIPAAEGQVRRVDHEPR